MTEPPVPADLARLVAGSWILTGVAVPRGLPQPAVDLVVMPDEQVRRVLAFMHAAPGAPVARHAAEVGLSERHLRRRFVVAVGLRPKAYIRVVRLHGALAAARAGLARGEPPQGPTVPPNALLRDVRFLQSSRGPG